MKIGDRVKILIDVDEGCYKCVPADSEGVVTSLDIPKADITMPWIGVDVKGYRTTWYNDDELEVIG